MNLKVLCLSIALTCASGLAEAREAAAQDSTIDAELELANSLVEGSFKAPALLAKLSAYYRAHARVRLGKERRLANGIAWRLVTDTATGLAGPRITWMPKPGRAALANRFLEALHGSSLLNYSIMEKGWPAPPEGIAPTPRDSTNRFIWQHEVAVTYATSSLVSYFELAQGGAQGTSIPFYVRGWTIDLDSGTVLEMGACPGEVRTHRKGLLFAFGDLLEVCDRPSRERFIDLLAAAAKRVDTEQMRARHPDSVPCFIGSGSFDDYDREFFLYLTPFGLAVYNTTYEMVITARSCTAKRSVFNPLIIPYRELEPFMIPGPLKDELLAPATPAR